MKKVAGRLRRLEALLQPALRAGSNEEITPVLFLE
jgi:hypothetical protein